MNMNAILSRVAARGRRCLWAVLLFPVASAAGVVEPGQTKALEQLEKADGAPADRVFDGGRSRVSFHEEPVDPGQYHDPIHHGGLPPVSSERLGPEDRTAGGVGERIERARENERKDRRDVAIGFGVGAGVGIAAGIAAGIFLGPAVGFLVGLGAGAFTGVLAAGLSRLFH